MDAASKQTIGLDFGTSTSLVATPAGIVPIGRGRRWVPSIAAFDGELVVGEAAADMFDNQIRSVKRAITLGTGEVRVATKQGARTLPADDVIVAILREVIERAAGEQLTLKGNDAVRMGCPAMWDRKQRTRLLLVAERAGLSVGFENLIDEPVAAGLAWLASNPAAASSLGQSSRIVVFDMGGGTLDVAVLQARAMGHHEVSVLAALGVSEAGDSLDDAIAEELELQLAAEGTRLDDQAEPDRARQELKWLAQVAKVELSQENEHPITMLNGTSIWYTRKQLEEVFTPQMERAEYYVAAALRAAKLTEALPGSAHDLMKTPIGKLAEEVDHVVLSGGMSRIPLVTQRMKALFPNATVGPASSDPDSAVALGLAAARKHGRINMFRPSFDIYVIWEGGDRQVAIYEAFTPLYESWQVVQGGTQIGYKRNGLDLDLPRKADGRLRVVSHSGTKARVTLNGQPLDGFPVALSDQKFEFFMQSNGRIRVTDANGTFEGRVEDWYGTI